MKRKFLTILLVLVGICGVASSGIAAEKGSAGVPAVSQSQVQELQGRMLGDEVIMALIQGMQNDPEIQALLSDPKVLQALQAGDTAALLKDPRFMKLLDNTQVKEIGTRLGAQGSGAEQ